MYITNISDAKANLSQLIKMVQENNETIIIGKAGKPVAVLSAYSEDESPRQLGGSWEGKVVVEQDYDSSGAVVTESFYSSAIFPEEK